MFTLEANHSERSDFKLHVRLHQIVETLWLKHDGSIGVELEDKRLIIIADRTYFSVDKVDRYATTNENFVIRLKDTIQFNRIKTLKLTKVEEFNVFADFKLQLLSASLPIEWRIGLKGILAFYGELYQINNR